MSISSSNEFLIVGSGAGGAVLANELVKAGKKNIRILECGGFPQNLGKVSAVIKNYNVSFYGLKPTLSDGGVIVWRICEKGGSTVFTLSNAISWPQTELKPYGIDISKEISEITEEMNICSIPDEQLGQRSILIREAANKLGYTMRPTPKMVDFSKCVHCGQCVFGCIRRARWTALSPLQEAEKHGLNVEYNVSVKEVLTSSNRCFGVKAVKGKESIIYYADTVILAAGALGTPVILQNSGIKEAGKQLFIDVLQNTYGLVPDSNFSPELPMSLLCTDFYEADKFILFPYAPVSRLALFYDLGISGLAVPTNRLIGIMTKCADSMQGQVLPSGNIIKNLTKIDEERLQKASKIAANILKKAGVTRSSLRLSAIQGSHPGGTAAVGVVVDKSLQTRFENLYICDASIFPKSTGLPPIVTIAALAKRLAKHLTDFVPANRTIAS